MLFTFILWYDVGLYTIFYLWYYVCLYYLFILYLWYGVVLYNHILFMIWYGSTLCMYLLFIWRRSTLSIYDMTFVFTIFFFYLCYDVGLLLWIRYQIGEYTTHLAWNVLFLCEQCWLSMNETLRMYCECRHRFIKD